ncbi:MAG: response regulator [Bacillota bacterium]|nr:response regulator [Bacillota bacterium]
MNTPNYKYLVAEDEYLIRRNLIHKIEALQLPLELAGEVSNGLDARILIDKVCPDLVITDIRMPQFDGLKLSEYINKNYPHINIIILSGYNDFSYAQSAIKFQVKDYLLKPVTTEALSEALQKILISLQSESKELNNICFDTTKLDQKSICELIEKYLQEHYQTDISFSQMGEYFGFTQEYLGKIFKKHSGETLSKYVTRLRMNEAKRLLLGNPDLEIQKIGELVGYKDGFYFSRTFKSYTGIQPSEFRNQNSEP